MRLTVFLATGFLSLMCAVVSAMAEERVALVVGNGSYGTVAPLDNPISDATLIGRTLEGLGFKVTLVTDATQIDMKRAISQFGRALRSGGPDTIGLFYYAGHGVQSFGTNYLLPVDASLTDAADLDLVGLDASAVLRQMASARNRTNIVILDACRNNPFEEIASLNDNGLAEMKAPTGTYLAYATAPGSVALDGLEGNSPFTLALADQMTIENLPIEQVFKNVRVKVIDQTRGAQTPWDTSSLTNDFVFKAGVQLTAEEVAEQQLWRSVERSRDAVQVMLFLRSFPAGRFQDDARNLLSEIMASELGMPKAEEPKVVETPKTKTPGLREADLIEAARASGRLEDYEAFLEEFPTGVFAELAKLEIATLSAKAAENAAIEAEKPEKEADVDGPTNDDVAALATPVVGPVQFDVPLAHGSPNIVGRTLEELVVGSPTFPPIEGIPEEMWKGQSCSNCHKWTREALCVQAKTYVASNAQRSLSKQHPFGGTFKQNLGVWAAGGCE